MRKMVDQLKNLACNTIQDAVAAYFAAKLILLKTDSVTERTVREVVCSDAFRRQLQKRKIEFPNLSRGQFAAMAEFCNWLTEAGLHQNMAGYFHWLDPHLVYNWAKIYQAMGTNSVAPTLTLLYHIFRAIEDALPVDEAVFYESQKEFWIGRGITEAEISEVLDAVQGFHFKKGSIKKSKAFLMAEQIYTEEFNSDARCLLHEWLQMYLGKRGRLQKYEETIRDSVVEKKKKILEKLVKAEPSDVVMELRHKDFLDATVEVNVMLPFFLNFLTANSGCAYVYNPSPLLLRHVAEEIPQQTPDLNFVLLDEEECVAFRCEFPQLSIIHAKELDREKEINSMLILPGGIELIEIYSAIPTNLHSLYILLPQTALSGKTNILPVLAEKSMSVKGIVGLPKEIFQTAPVKKIILIAEKSKEERSAVTLERLLYSSEYQLLKWDRKIYTITEPLKSATFRELWTHKEQEERYPYINHPKRAAIYYWSKELPILYSIHGRKDGVEEGNACIKEVCVLESGVVPGKLTLVNTRKGLRSKDRDEILKNIGEIPLREDVYDKCAASLKKSFQNCPERLSYKGLYLCLRNNMKSLHTFRHSLLDKLLFGQNRALADLVPAYSTGEQVQAAIQEILGKENFPTEVWKQILLLLQAAITGKYLAANPLKEFYQIVRDKEEERLQEAFARVRKRSFSQAQERNIFGEIIAPSETDPSYRRYETDAKWLLAAFTLFSPLSRRALLNLKISDLVITDQYTGFRLEEWEEVKYLAGPPILGKMFQNYANFLRKTYNFETKDRNSAPVFGRLEQHGKRRRFVPITDEEAKRVYKKMIECAEIIPTELPLLDREAKDLRSVQLKNIFDTNFAVKALLYCGLDYGEVQWLQGSTSDVVDRNYFGFEAEYNLARVGASLRRWTAPYEALLETKPSNQVQHKVIEGGDSFQIVSRKDKAGCIELTLIMEEATIDRLKILGESEYGHNISVECFEEV